MAHVTRYSIPELKELWAMLYAGKKPPQDSQWALWFLMHDPDTVREGITQLAAKYRKLKGQMDDEYMARFASAVMNRISREQHECNKMRSNMSNTNDSTATQIAEVTLDAMTDYSTGFAIMEAAGPNADEFTHGDLRTAIEQAQQHLTGKQ